MMLRNRMIVWAGAALFLVNLAHGQTADQFFESDGVKIRYVVEGEGEPLVLVHGFVANTELNWKQPGIFGALAQDYKVIALDNRGHGKSDKPQDPAQYGAQMAKDIVNLLDHLEIEKAHVAGYSLGGFITLKLIAEHPERVHSAIIGGAGWNDGSGNAGPTPEFAEVLASSLESGNGIAPLMEALTPAGQPKPTAEAMKAQNAMIMALNDPKALAAVVRGMVGLMVDESRLKANKVPVVCIVGEIDPLKAAADAMVGKTGAFEGVVVVPGGDHINALNHPRFVEAMKEFLAKHPMPKMAEKSAAGR